MCHSFVLGGTNVSDWGARKGSKGNSILKEGGQRREAKRRKNPTPDWGSARPGGLLPKLNKFLVFHCHCAAFACNQTISCVMKHS